MPTSPSPRDRARRALRWAWVALAISVALIVAKAIAFWISRSDAVLSDLLESTVNVVTGLAATASTWLASQPRDDDHPYGHGRVEFFSASFQGGMIVAAGASILVVTALSSVEPSAALDAGVGALFSLAIAVCAWLGGHAVTRAGRALDAAAVTAEGVHLRADALTTFGAFLALTLVHLTGWWWLDPLTAAAIGLWLIVSGVRLLRSSVGALMDEASDELLVGVLQVLEAERRPGWLRPHWARVQRFGMHVHIDLHLVLPRFWSLKQAHDVATRLEAVVETTYGPLSELMLHLEPCAETDCASCDLDACPVRSQPFERRRVWTLDTVRRPARDDVAPDSVAR